MKYFEDFQVGDKIVIGRHTFSAEEIKSFAERFDPQPFHLDETAAARSQFGALCASGWHTAVMWMRLRMDQMRGEVEEQRARG
ncbi:MAG TPA: MaoC/PaaZ C-terminal domain-containing protein, partial [Xanthobacteraceae bacterium]|nr:MaoC/PaaZ C-terminal domain-containing protein [Xanthobacteraceae bacterium]